MWYDEKTININHSVIITNIITEPLLVVPDEDDDDDDDDEYEKIDSPSPLPPSPPPSSTTITSNNILLNHTEEETIISNERSIQVNINQHSESESTVEVINLIELNKKSKVEELIKLNKKSKAKNRALKKANKSIQTIVIDTSFIQKTTRKRIRKPKPKNLLTSNNLSADSAVSYVSFDKTPNILTVSRMGSIYYCVEDLYIKIYSSLCTLDEFINLLVKPQIILLKQVTLSEKIAIAQESPKLNKINHIRYRLISIDSSDYLIKLKQLLVSHKSDTYIEKIINQMRTYRQTSTSSPSHNKISSTKHLPTTNTGQDKDVNETVPKATLIDDNFIECPVIKFETCSSSSIQEDSLNLSSRISSSGHLHRSESLQYNKEQIKNSFSRSSSLPPMNFQPKTPETIDFIDEKYSMPMIVDVEENVQVDDQEIESSELFLSSPQNSLSPISTTSSSSVSYPDLYHYSSYSQTPARIPYNLYYPLSPSNTDSSPSSNFEKTDHHHSLTPESQISSITCLFPCSCSHQLPTDQAFISKERMTYKQYSSSSPASLEPNLSQTILKLKLPSLSHRKQNRIESSPYVLTKTYYAPLIHHPSPENPVPIVPYPSPEYPVPTVHHPSPQKLVPIAQHPSPQSPLPTVPRPKPSTKKNPSSELKLPYTNKQSIDLSQAIIGRNQCDIDKIPKLVVRHSKVYLTKTIDAMGQLFPTWFNEPDYRCIHCFSCDQVFTPQLFMTHTDDKQMVNEKPLTMTSIQLLPSEKMFAYKVKLWNRFCTNLTIYASKFPKAEKIKSSKRKASFRFLGKRKVVKKQNQENNSSVLIAPVTSILTVNELM